MPFPFTLPTTSSFSYSAAFSCHSHPSFPPSASTHRGILRAALKHHKRLPAPSQPSHLTSVVSSVDAYLPCLLLAVDSAPPPSADGLQLRLRAPPDIEWRPTLVDPAVPGVAGKRSRVKVGGLDYEVFFVLGTLANAHTLMARAALHPLYDTAAALPDTQARTAAITTATKHLLESAAVYNYLAVRAERSPPITSPPCPDVAPATARALSSLALAEATLLAVLKDDPYPAVVAQDRNRQDREWMYKAPSIPKVRAHLFARLCLAAADHASRAASLCRTASAQGAGAGGKVSDALLRYLDDLRRTSRAKACRFFGIDAELGGEMGTALAWLRAALGELGAEPAGSGGAGGGDKKSGGGGGFGLGKLRREWSERREERRVETEAMWGMDAGRMEEVRVVEMLNTKWNKINDTMNTQLVPPVGPLLAKMPTGREMYTIKEYQPPVLDRQQLESFRVPPEQPDDCEKDDSSGDDGARAGAATAPGAFPSGAGSDRDGYY